VGTIVEAAQHRRRLGCVTRLAQDFAVERDDGITGNHNRTGMSGDSLAWLRADSTRFGLAQSDDQFVWEFAWLGNFCHVRHGRLEGQS
jgi:hypothetical protein